MTAALEGASTAFGELAVAADDEAVTPEALADRVVGLLTEDLCARMISEPDFVLAKGRNRRTGRRGARPSAGGPAFGTVARRTTLDLVRRRPRRGGG